MRASNLPLSVIRVLRPISSKADLQVSPKSAKTECRRSQSRETVPAPRLRAHSVVDEEEPARVVLLLDFGEPWIIVTPEGPLPIFFEVVGLVHIGSASPGDRAKLLHTFIDRLRAGACLGDVGLMPRNSRISATLPVSHDSQREGGQDSRIHSCVFRSRYRLAWGTGKALVEMQSDARVSRSSKQRVGKARLGGACEQRRWQPE